jgi:hypothetical protein
VRKGIAGTDLVGCCLVMVETDLDAGVVVVVFPIADRSCILYLSKLYTR